MSTRNLNKIWNQEKSYCLYWLKVVPHFRSVMFHLAGAYMKEKNYPDARGYYIQALENRFGDWEIYTNLGLMDYEEGNNRKALDNFQKALKIFPQSATVHNNLGLVYLKDNLVSQAEQAFAQAASYNRFLLEPRLNLAGIYSKKSEFDKALVLYKENLEIAPDDKPSVLGLIETLFAAKNKEKAVKSGKDLLRKNKDAKFLTQLGGVFALHRYNNLALAFYAKALKVNPQYTPVYLEMGKLYGNLEQFNQAIVVWQEGAAIDPTDVQFKEHIEKALELQKNN